MKTCWHAASAGFLLLILVGCGGGNSSGGGPPPPLDGPPSPSAGPFVPPPNNPASATLTYWNGVNSLPAQMASHMRGGPKDQVWALRDAAGVIRRNPTLGVDPELTDWAQRMATLLERRADLIEASRNPALLAEAFLRGVQGDPFGVGIELNQAERSWVASFRAVSREQHQIRARLTARYGIEFPNP
ncbi:MAG: hypothetical protein U0736_20735 [Gemmataceae bacterium]